MKGYKQISFSNLKPDQADILIALLTDAGIEGFEETENNLEAFIAEEKYDKSKIEKIAETYSLPFQEKHIKNINWNQLWESNFKPVTIGNFLAIRADFHPEIKDAVHEIIITPKMSFGTGHHATTFMMIEEMKEIDFTNKLVFDFGTGTGILAILAEKLGARKVFSIDNDDWSIENAKENFKKNYCNKIDIVKASDAGSGKKSDIILANINKNVILANIPVLKSLLSEQGILLISGILAEDRAEIISAATHSNFQLQKENKKLNWLCLKFLS